MSEKILAVLNRVADVVLNYRPATKGKPRKPKARKKRAKKKVSKNG